MLFSFKTRKANSSHATAELLNSGYRYALSLCKNAPDAEDMTQEAWLRLNKRYGKTPCQAVMFTTIRNLYIDSYRRENVANQYRQEIQFNATEPMEHICEDVLAERALQHSLHALRDAEREALFLSVVAGYTAAEIAELTQKNRGTVLSLIHRAKISLKKAYQQKVDDTVVTKTTPKETAATLATAERDAK